jgi:hypothetical protein
MKRFQVASDLEIILFGDAGDLPRDSWTAEITAWHCDGRPRTEVTRDLSRRVDAIRARLRAPAGELGDAGGPIDRP